MKTFLFLTSAALAASLTTMPALIGNVAVAADLAQASVLNSDSVLQRGGLAVTPNLQIFGRKPPLPPKGGKVTPPDKPPVLTVIAPGMSDTDTKNAEAGHGLPKTVNLRQFNRADGTFLRN